MYEVKDSKIVLTFSNNDGRTFKITKDQREYKISVYGEFSNNRTNFDYDIYMNYGDMYVINRTLDTLSGFSRSYTDTNWSIFNQTKKLLNDRLIGPQNCPQSDHT